MKPFVKWAGGKTKLLKGIEQRLPVGFDEWKDVTYVEPFVGGGIHLGLDISTHGLNFADLKIDGFPPDGIPKVINYKGERWKVREIFVSLSILHYFCIVTK